MRKIRSFFSGTLVLFSCLFAFPHHLTAAESGEYIAIRKEGASKIALVLDRPDAKGRKESEWAGNIDAVIHEGLDFTNYFSVIAPPLNVKEVVDKETVRVNFSALNSVGAEVYAGGRVFEKSGQVTLDMEVFESAGGKSLLKKSYKGRKDELRTIGHAFCADLVELLTGKKSVFGSRIVFVSNKTGFKEIYECDFDGYGLEQLTNTKSITLTPALSPDGKYLAYTDFTAGHPALYIRNLSDRKTSFVSKNGISIDPGWRGSSEVATTLSYEGDQEIYLVRPDGSVSRRVTNSKGIDVSPTFSPDGSKMAFVSSRNGLPQIFVQDIHSGEVKRLTFSGRYNTQPSWSPSGDKIAYTTWEKNGEINIFVINADGSSLRQLTRNAQENEAPSWSPDGEMIVFSSNRQGAKKLYVMSASGENQRRLLQVDGEQMQPFWSVFR
ncbi:Tol-Pal system beta propeller repeat protein TolB [Chlorobium sp. BLA1]|uniref:Tol-Pal system beta propeller repeat protein TolB n=1 Tax=Candidatus Chlorobium masyuteum TaxID=2716876 RepID=UPI0014226137|nr:Tol-Pal system beta propeller repeat protein TolB [Candidatus Chlorobium masyuteum]NHQ60616.1 Tol-Pal system beta propeller repeat protein TolB [Candidatus Chlorobium masyuteum]NTU45620.1 Tol-Pal system beta propeller repeat protein TolB [Chlorobiaceae bacterium]